MKRKNEGDFLVFAKLCIENLEEKPSIFLKKANKIDLLRNTFSNSILYNYFLYVKRYLKDEYKVKAMPQKLCNIIDSLKRKQSQIECAKPKVLSYEEIIKHINNELNNLEEKIKTQINKNTQQMQLLVQMNNDILKYREDKILEINEKKERLIKEYFERI